MASSEFTVTLLGTGVPSPTLDRFGASALVRAGTETLLFDCGRGTLQRLYQLNVPFQDARFLFLTHLHADHSTGIPDLWLTPPVFASRGFGRSSALKVHGPTGTHHMIDHLREAYSADKTAMTSAHFIQKDGYQLQSEELAEGVVYDRNGVTVSAFLVDHVNISPAYGFKVEYGGRVAVLSGDTTYCENLIKNAEGADLLVHEVALAPQSMRELPEHVRRCPWLALDTRASGHDFL
jgi:ribonuclease Z